MDFAEWEPVYHQIVEEMGYSILDDEASARLLRQLTMNKTLIDPDELRPLMRGRVNIIGAAAGPRDVEALEGTAICAGSAASAFIEASTIPDILVTDLDGKIEDQKECCKMGSVAVIHAHGDNHDLVQSQIDGFEGPMIITTQSRPDLVLVNFGGFTDGDRAVCMARHLGARDIHLIGFDFRYPVIKEGENKDVKVKKLRWAERIIFSMNPSHVSLTSY